MVKHKGYTEMASGLHYRYIAFGEGESKPQLGDVLELEITYKTLDDSVFLSSYNYNNAGKILLPVGTPSFNGSFEEGLLKMHQGDVYSFIVPADSLFTHFFKTARPKFLSATDEVKLDVRLVSIKTEAEVAEASATNQEQIHTESEKLARYLDTCGIVFKELPSGLLVAGEDSLIIYKPHNGATVSIHYTGSFLNGVVFESTYMAGKPLSFTYKKEGQVLEGMEQIIALLKQGSKQKFVLPSHLAYGAAGSSTGIVPPYTPIIYEVELISIN